MSQASISTMIPPICQDININNIYQIDPYVDEKEIQEIIQNTKHIKVTIWHDYALMTLFLKRRQAAAI